MNSHMKIFKTITKSDIALFFLLIAVGIALSIFVALDSKSGKIVSVKVSGKVYGTYSLNENKTITISRGEMKNVILIKDGKVRMKSANCKNKDCVHQGEISHTNEHIVCLPNRISIEILGGDERYDEISQ